MILQLMFPALSSLGAGFLLIQCGGGAKKEPESESGSTAAKSVTAPPGAPQGAPAPPKLKDKDSKEKTKEKTKEKVKEKEKSREIQEPTELTSLAFLDIMEEIDTFIFDADGVLWLGEDVIDGSPGFIEFLNKNDKQLIIMTNNTTKPRNEYATKLETLCYPENFNDKIMVNPAVVTADYLKTRIEPGKKVYVIGDRGVRHELENMSIAHFGSGPEDSSLTKGPAPYLYDFKLDVPASDVGAVVVAYEKHFHYLKLLKVANYLKDPNTLFLVTNEDETTPGPNPNLVIPDCGPISAAVKNVTGREPVVMGKPETAAFEYIRKKFKVDPVRTMMIGDRTNTDVKFGKKHGLKTLLVLSGVHQLEDVKKNILAKDSLMVPDYFAQTLGALVPRSDCSTGTGSRDNNNNNN